jgi:hypothetical protein
MSEWQPQQHDPRRQQQPRPWEQPGYAPPVPQAPQRHAGHAAGKTSLTAAEKFWYVLQCIAMGAGYFAKIPAKKALADFGMAELTSAEKFWYVLQCVFFGAGYLAKVPTAKALSELPQFRAGR